MEHEDFYSLMMEALDGELYADDQELLDAHLHTCSACMREWDALVSMDALFRRTPILVPLAGFTERTLARLPNRRVRLWAMGTIYMTLLLSGLLPVLLVLVTAVLLMPVLREPAIVESIGQILGKGVQLAGAMVGALLNASSQLIIEQPSVLGWLLVMVGVVFLWSGVYRQLLSQPALTQRQTM